ncbi:TetR family transcriptional regulator [Acetobacterium paludosum]|uniref:TetR family transcriptional regulator n=1 Tax=Acetobacterium paludosum TaxID=52693 RepID=A0A923KXF7_9FIRM|nr:TetR/AcrR family transcriptional regulator [Acetobacterium paludosum]MBC3889535.1 TetR family transcriptional regulator [Acetobacterium paludosum]
MEKDKKIQERTIVNRKKILDSAQQLFNTKGYYNTNTKEIAKLAGVSTGSFYNYFPDKLSIFQEIMIIFLNRSYLDLCELAKKLDQQPQIAKATILRFVQNGMDHAYEDVVMFQDFDSIVMANPELNDIQGEFYDKILNEIYTFCNESPYVKQRTENPLVMSRMAYFLVQGTSAFVAKLPDDTDKSEYQEQLVEIVYWYLFGS